MHRIFHFQSKLEIKKKGNNFQNATFMKVELGEGIFEWSSAHLILKYEYVGKKELFYSAQFY